MLDIGFMEILVIGAIALIVVGPKELPGLLRTVGQYAGKARGMAREFQRTMDEAAREADLGDVADAVKGGGKNKLPFGNQVVDSLKDFEKTVKSEVNEAARAADQAVSAPETPKIDPVKAANEAASRPFNPAGDAPKAEQPKIDATAEPSAKTDTAPDQKSA